MIKNIYIYIEETNVIHTNVIYLAFIIKIKLSSNSIKHIMLFFN